MTKFTTKKQVLDFVEECLNETCIKIQSAFAQQDGGFAGQYWTGPARAQYYSLMARYILMEQEDHMQSLKRYMEDDHDKVKREVLAELDEMVEF